MSYDVRSFGAQANNRVVYPLSGHRLPYLPLGAVVRRVYGELNEGMPGFLCSDECPSN